MAFLCASDESFLSASQALSKPRWRRWTAALLGVAILVASHLAAATTIHTYGGNPIPNGVATSIGNGANGIAVDPSGNVYFADSSNHTIRKVDPLTGLSSVIAGRGTSGFSGDGGPALNAQLNSPRGVALDSAGNLYIADTSNHRIRKIDAATGNISTIAGTGTGTFGGDNAAATAARVNSPQGVALDSAGNVYIADTSNNRVRKIDAGTGNISTVAGNGTGGYLADNVAATGTRINAPRSVVVDGSGNLYIADTSNNRIRKVNTGGTITTVAGTGAASFSGDNGAATSATIRAPQGVTLDGSGNLYIADTTNHRIRKVSAGIITTLSGTGSAGYGGDNGVATSGQLSSPAGIAVDGSGTLYIGDTGNLRVRKISGGTITTFAGTGSATYGGDGGPVTNAQFTSPQDVAFDGAGNVYLSDSGTHRIRKVAPDGTITTVAGTGVAGYSGDNGPATSARINTPLGIALDASGNLYIADGNNNRIRKVDTLGVMTTFAGDGTGSFGGDNGPATSAQLFGPFNVKIDSLGNVYITDTGNNRIRKVNAGGTITTFAGTGTASFSGDGGAATSATFNTPIGLAIDGADNLYVTDYSNGAVRKIASGTGIITTVAGTGANGYGGDNGLATSAQLNSPRAVVVDSAGNIYITDTTNSRIRKVDAGGIITTIAGNGAAAFSGDGGAPASAQVSTPQGIALYGTVGIMVSDTGNRRFRLITDADPPTAPASVAAVAGNASATVSFAAPASDGGSAITGYTVVSNPAGGIDSNAGGTGLSHVVTGLTNGVAYTFTVTATNVAGPGPASAPSNSVTPAFANGACGPAANVTALFRPVLNLCTAGNPSAVSDTSPWGWSCNGINGGTTASCTAPVGLTASGTGAARIAVSGGGWTVDLTGTTGGKPNTAGAIDVTGNPKSPADPPPAGYTFPHGLYDFTLTGGAGPATVVITYPSALPPGTVYWKYGKTAPADAPHWHQFPGAVISGDRLSITLTLTDGALGDDDGTVNGVITDPGGAGVPVDGVEGIPTLSQWAMVALSLLLFALGAPVARRQLK
jgi:sugar lactone lactonase YvrE